MGMDTHAHEKRKTCIHCTRKQRIFNVHHLSKGDHILYGGGHLMNNLLFDRQSYFYTHHAIVEFVEPVSDVSANVTLIHFYSRPFEKTNKIRESNELLNLTHNEIYILKYRHVTHPADEIVKRAKDHVKDGPTYDPFVSNCEHFCHWCCIGKTASFQVQSKTEIIKKVLLEIGTLFGWFSRAAARFISYSVDDILAIVKGVVDTGPWGVLVGTTFLYLAYAIWRTITLTNEKANGDLCSTCCSDQIHDLWLRFGACTLLQVGGLGLLSTVLNAGATKGIVGLVSLAWTLFIIMAMWLVSKVRRILMPPFKGNFIDVSFAEVQHGDVVSFKHWGLSHAGVVDTVNGKGDIGKLSVIHYALPNIFGRRKVVQEDVKVDIKKDKVWKYDYSGYDTHLPEKVVQRAKQRIGETKFGLFTNRSCHFCHWAKTNEENELDVDVTDRETGYKFICTVRQGDNIEGLRELNVDHKRNKKHATKTLASRWARIPQEIKKGEIVEFKYRGSWHKGVSTKVTFNDTQPASVCVWVVHNCSKGCVCEERLEFNLKTEDVWIHGIHPAFRYRKNEVIRRARAKIGGKTYSTQAPHIPISCDETVRKDIDVRVREIDELIPGDVITYIYWSLKHHGLVSRVQAAADTKGNYRGTVRVIHYAWQDILSTRTITEEDIRMDLRKDPVYKKNYTGFVVHPRDIVLTRARDRIGEQRFNSFSNNSSDFVHWSKVVQRPAKVVKGNEPVEREQNLQRRSDTGHLLLLPGGGTIYDGFQKSEAHFWSDLEPGTIVDYSYYWIRHQGILSEVDKAHKRIKVIHIGAEHLFAKRTVIEDTKKLEFERDSIKIYIGHPGKCHAPKEVLHRARKRIGEQNWGVGKTSWNFCLDCVKK